MSRQLTIPLPSVRVAFLAGVTVAFTCAGWYVLPALVAWLNRPHETAPVVVEWPEESEWRTIPDGVEVGGMEARDVKIWRNGWVEWRTLEGRWRLSFGPDLRRAGEPKSAGAEEPKEDAPPPAVEVPSAAPEVSVPVPAKVRVNGR